MKTYKDEVPPCILIYYEQWSRLLKIKGIDLFFNDILINSGMNNFGNYTIAKNLNTISFDIIDIDGESLGLYDFNDDTYYGLMKDFIKKLDDLDEIK